VHAPVHRRRRGLVLALLLALAGCGGEAGANGPGGKKGGEKGEKVAEPLAVAVVRLAPATIERFYRTAGTLRALRTADLVALQPGIVRELNAEEGDRVRAGQVLVRLDARGFKLQAARDALAARNAEQELRRIEQIAENLPREELDKQRYALESALASAQVSRHQASQTVVVAPFDGTITRRAIDIGNLATASTALYSVADLSVLDVDLHVPEREAGAVQAGAPATLELQDGTRFAAAVLRRAPVVDPLTGTVKFTVRARDYPAGAVPGAFVRAELLVDRRPSAPSVPRAAVFELEGVSHVYAVEDGRARRKKVELGLIGEDRVELRGGVDPSAQIVADAAAGITEGMPVKPLGEAGKGAPDGAGPKDRAVEGAADPKDSPDGATDRAVPKDSPAVPKDSPAGAADPAVPKDSPGGSGPDGRAGAGSGRPAAGGRGARGGA
jgi:membrane fusion protein (multidrug efflux system)